MMMELRKVEEALELAKVAMQTELGSSRDKLVSVIYCQILGMSKIFKRTKRQWSILNTGSRLDDMENSKIFKTMKR